MNMSRQRWHEIIFEADTPAGKAFDVLLLVAIVLSVLAVMLESVASIGQQYGKQLALVEWLFTVMFTVEYLVRLWVVQRPFRYALSFFGLVDFLAVVPTYLSLVVGRDAVAARDPSIPLTAGVPRAQTGSLPARGSDAPGRRDQQHAQDHRLHFHGPVDRAAGRYDHVPHRGTRPRLHQRTARDVLGGRNVDHGGLR